MSFQNTKLGEVFDIVRGGSPRPIDRFITNDPSGLNWIMIGDAAEGSKYIRSTKKKVLPSALNKTRVVHPGDFLLTNSMSFGRPYITQVTGCIHDGWLALTPKDREKTDPDFYYHLLGSQTLREAFEKQAAGAVVKNLNINLVKNIGVRVPNTLDEQRRIAEILDKADAIRRKREQALTLADDFLRSMFLEMFCDRGWPTVPLAEAVATGTIVTYGIVQAGPEIDGGIPYIRTGDIKNGEIMVDGLRHTSPEIASKFARSRVRRNEIVMSIRATVGTTAIVPPELDGANLTQGTARIAPGENTTLEYLLSYLRSQNAQAWIEGQVKGATFREITLTRLRELPVPIPPLELQQKFSAVHQKNRGTWRRLKDDVANAADLFASLSQRAFAGNL